MADRLLPGDGQPAFGPDFLVFLSAVPDFSMAAVALTAWHSPLLLGRDTVSYVLLVFLVEFVAVHSAAFMVRAEAQPDKFKKIGGVLGLGLFFTLFVGIMALAFRRWWPIFFFWGLTLNRLLRGLIAPEEETPKATITVELGASAVFYMCSILAGFLLPLPRLGLDCRGEGCYGLAGEGLWIDKPQIVIFSCALYFLLQGLFKIFGPAISGRPNSAPLA